MCHDNPNSWRRLAFMALMTLLITPFLLESAQATMVITPSTIVINSAFDDGNYKNSSINEYTVKAIIQYAQTPLPPGSKLSKPFIDLYRKLSSGELESITSAVSIRYCFDDDVLIVEFDRSEVADYLSDEKVRGVIDVVVKGEFTLTTDTVPGVTASLTESVIELEEEGQLLSTSPVKGR